MSRSAAVSISVTVMMIFLWPISICHHTETQRQVRSGSWGSWGPWQDCSRSCGGGLQEQMRVCLPHHSRQSSVNPSQQTRILDVQNRPAAVENTGTNPPKPHQRPLTDSRRAWRTSNSSRISLGTYGYGRVPYITRLQKVSRRSSERRQRRSHRRNSQSNSRRWPAWASVQHSHLQQKITETPTSLPAGQYRRNITCPGPSNQHKICNHMACLSSSRPIRELQCSEFNTRPFMGRLYEWEPFSDGELDCQLNCRAAGFRFYVRLSEDIIDGSSCGQNGTSVCVAGKCETVGCDDLVGSVKVRDGCGVCGGDGRSCKLISGLFQHSLSKVGYHKIVEIPPGATKINITEMMKSRNYLALRSRSGRSIINGNWAIDHPGMYEGVGTMFTYRRPNEISSTAGESCLADGPTNEILDVYMIYQQPNPGVHYEFIMPSEKNTEEPQQICLFRSLTITLL